MVALFRHFRYVFHPLPLKLELLVVRTAFDDDILAVAAGFDNDLAFCGFYL
jgi:hypothetical protein